MPSGSADERFHTPRNSARRAGYASSEDERFTTPRGTISSRSSDYETPRCEAGGSYSSDEHEPFYSGRDDGYSGVSMMRMPFVAEIHDHEDYPTGSYEPNDYSYDESQVNESDIADIFSMARHNKVIQVEELLDQGIPVNVRDSYGNTILSIACQNGLKKLVKATLRRGADINSQNYRGNTPLHFCFAYGYGETLGAYLISKGADTTVRSKQGNTCYEGI